METRRIVLFNVLNGLFISRSQNLEFYDEGTNLEIPAYDEILILNEYTRANFVRITDFVQKAETKSFFFYRYDEDQDDDITWIEVKNAEPMVQ